MAISPVPVTATSMPTWVRTAATVINAVLRSTNALVRRPQSTVTQNTTTGGSDYLTLIDSSAGPVTVTLPPVEMGRQLAYKRVTGGGNAVTLSGPIDGVTSTSLPAQWDGRQLIGGLDRWLSL